LSSPLQSTKIFNITRASSIFSEPSFFAHYLVAMLGLTLPAVLHRPRLLGSRLVLWCAIGAQMTGLVMSMAMTGFYLLIQLMVVMLLFEGRQTRARLVRWILVLGLAGGIVLVGVQTLTSYPVLELLAARIVGIIRFIMGDQTYLIEGESLFMRISTSQIALRVFQDHPLWGVGLGSYTLVSPQYGEWNPAGFAANTLVDVLAETGIIGFVTLIGLAFSSLFGLWRVFRREHGPDESGPAMSEDRETTRLICRMVFYLLVIEILFWHVGNSLFLPATWFYFGLAGLATVHARRSAAERA